VLGIGLANRALGASGSKTRPIPVVLATDIGDDIDDTWALGAVYLAMSNDLCAMEKLKIRVTDDGFTKIDPNGKSMSVATAWLSLDA
jgi:hypothetical protein